MAKKITEKQARSIVRDARGDIVDMLLILEYSTKLLEDYKGDMKAELKEVTATIKKGKEKYKKISDRLSASGHGLLQPKVQPAQ